MIFSPAFVALWPWRMNQRNRRLLDEITSICREVIGEKREELKSTTVQSKGHKDLLSLLIESGSFSTPQLVDHMLTFLAAGHETTWSSFTWIAYHLAKHPDIQQRLRDEVLSHLPSARSANPCDEAFDLTTIDKLPLLNAVCDETLRLYPPIPVTVRDVVRPTQLAGQYVTLGTQVILCPYAINRDETLWGADADDFKPERSIDVDRNTGEQQANHAGGASSNYAFLTFLHGPRSCIGQGFAKAELRFLVAAFMAGFEMEMGDPGEDVTPYGVVAVKPKNGMRLRLKPLQG